MALTNNTSILHTVIFKLIHPKGSAQELDFLNAAKNLAELPGVEKFECLKQVSKKNKFDYALSMEFSSQQVYDQYNNNPEHVAFVQQRWLKEVEDFFEIDYQRISQ